MQHALVISADAPTTGCLEDSLWNAGFRSIFQVTDEEEALAIVRSVRSSLIVVAADRAVLIREEALCYLSDMAGAPVVVAAANPAKALQCLCPWIPFGAQHSMNGFGMRAKAPSPYPYDAAA